MECDEARSAISAGIDGAGQLSPDAAHVEGCPDCRRWEERAHDLARATLRPATDVVLRVPGIRPQGFLRYRWLRIVLAWGGLLLVVWNLSPIVAPGGDPAAVHLARHQAAFSAALGLTYLAVAWRPDRAYGLVPFAAIFAVTLTVTGAVDILRGTSTVGAESAHLLEIAGLVVLWVLGAAAGPGRRRNSRELSLIPPD